MSASTQQVTRAFILRTVDYRDSDRILTLLTRDLGKISAIARWARSSRKRFGGALEPFSLLEVSLSAGRGHDKMFLLTEALLVDSHPGLATDLDRIGSAALVTELVRELTPENDPDPRMFDFLREFMSLVSAPKTVSVKGLALCAVLRVLAFCGVAVGIGRCTACGTPVPQDKKAYFDPRRGGIVCTPCGGGPILLCAGAATALTLMEKRDLDTISTMTFDDTVFNEIYSAINQFTERQLDHPLRSSFFLDQVK